MLLLSLDIVELEEDMKIKLLEYSTHSKDKQNNCGILYVYISGSKYLMTGTS